MKMCWIALATAVWLVVPAGAQDEPFGQETVETRPWRNPPRPEAKRDHRHQHPDKRAHSHGPAHKHSHGPTEKHAKGHKHAAGHKHAKGHGHSHGAREHRHGPEGDAHHHHGVETEHLFGFTIGSDIDAPGTKHIIADMSGSFGRQTGSYAAISKQLEFGFTPWRDVHIGLGASFATHRISGVEGLDDRRQIAFEGLSVDFRRRLLDRAQAPFGLMLKMEPHWARIDEETGERANKYAVEFVLAADKELIKDRLYGAFNVIYEPEWVRLTATGETERTSTVGFSLAGMTPLTPSIFAGGEVRYLRKYEGAVPITFAGEALFLGPVVFINANDRIALIAAYSAQVAGRPAGGAGPLDLQNFERHRAKLKAVIHF